MKFVTVFNKKFLGQGALLCRSLLITQVSSSITVFTDDLDLEPTLLGFFEYESRKKIKVQLLKEIETGDLLEAKATRSPREYYWTLASTILSQELEKSDCPVAYVDADTFYFRDIATSFEHFFGDNNKHVLITPHFYDHHSDYSWKFGIYCVQLVIGKPQGRDIIRNWAQECLEWCYDRIEGEKYGDQKYLDYWPIKYGPRVYVASKEHPILGPWNQRSIYDVEPLGIHFQGLRVSKSGYIDLGHDLITHPRFERYYLPYIESLRSILGLRKKSPLVTCYCLVKYMLMRFHRDIKRLWSHLSV